jgi:hypothetical protein
MREDAANIGETTLLKDAAREVASATSRLTAILDLTLRGEQGLLKNPAQAIEILSLVSSQPCVPEEVREAAETGMIAIRKRYFPLPAAPG